MSRDPRLEKLFPLIFHSISEGVFTVDEDFRITSFNDAAQRVTGVSAADAVGKPCHEVLKASICQGGCALRKTMEDGEPRRDIRVDILNARMEQVPIAVSTAVLRDENGHLVGGVEIFRDLSEVESLRTELAGRNQFHDIIGGGEAMQRIFALIPQLAQSEAPVLVTGPSGTGKELMAQAIHDLSKRSDEPFVKVNCGALPDTLLESELFGYKKGAFTGAVTDRPGRFGAADGGTLFLDEIGDVSPAFQVKLLRVLEEGEFQPLGCSQTIETDVRLICATNKDLGEMVKGGSFREDLYYRIRVFPLDLPPLKDRREDIPLLVERFVSLLSAKTGRPAPAVSSEALRLLYDYDYPGNIRELRNILERAFVIFKGSRIQVDDLPRELLGSREEPRSFQSSTPTRPTTGTRGDGSELSARLLEALDATGWNREEAAERLGMSRTTLWRKMKRSGLG